MDVDRFDAFARALAAPTGRRRLLRALAAGVAAGFFGRRRAQAAVDLQAFVDKASPVIARKMGLAPLPTVVVLAEPGKALCTQGERGSVTVACADPFDANAGTSGAVAYCNVLVDQAALRFGDRDLAEILAHEVFHCYQAAAVGLAHFYARPWGAWVDEGQAPWAAKMVLGELGYGATAASGRSWRDYLLQPEKPLMDRVYDAVGFYAQLAQSGVDPWRRFAPMLATGNDSDAYHAAADPAGATFLDNWAAGYFRDPALGPEWEITGPPPPDGTFKPDSLPFPVASGETKRFETVPFTLGLFRVSTDADLLRMAVIGHGRVADGAGTNTVKVQDAYFCIRSEGCECPPKTKPIAPLPDTPLKVPAALAVTGGPDGAIGSVGGVSLDTFCQPDEVCPPGGSCNNTPECAPGCGCMTTTEGTGACVPNPECKSVPPCLTSANCPPGAACVTMNCCEDGLPRCAPICTDQAANAVPDNTAGTTRLARTITAAAPG